MSILKKMLLALNAQHNKNETIAETRKGASYILRALRQQDPIKIMEELQKAFAHDEAEKKTWITSNDVAEHKSGPFDATDMMIWLEIAKITGVPYIEAREILRLSPEEMSYLSGEVRLPDNSTATAIAKAEKKNAGVIDKLLETHDIILHENTLSDEDKSYLYEKLYEAMDDVPEGWMVRSTVIGASDLKLLSSAGQIGDMAPTVQFNNDLEIGPGWVRNRNRRRVNVSDKRIFSAAVEGKANEMVFVARPWVASSEYIEAEDPNRAGTRYEGKGKWPAEWRAFVENGKVVGVSFYYSWVGEANTSNAKKALEVKELAQKMVDYAVENKLYPRMMKVEFQRLQTEEGIINNPEITETLDIFGRESVACTLDFLDTPEGLILLEGGPAYYPWCGGHPCGFAGIGGVPNQRKHPKIEGVAFKNMPHINLGKHLTWEDGDHTDCILTWEEVEKLANDYTLKPSI